MKKQTLKCLLALVLALASVASCALYIAAEENPNPDNKMAYNIYSEPQFGDVPMAFVTYSIDMRSDQVAPITYWSLANFSMYISDVTKKMYNQIEGGGCYAGIQAHGEKGATPRKAIMAFWEWHYWPNGSKPGAPIGKNSDGTDNWGETNLVAERIYPKGNSQFGGEGEGVNYIGNYAWKEGQWYRMVLHTWDDKATGNTFCGQWLCDLTTGKWTLISYFDTKMKQSYLTGNMHFFMENFVHTTAGEERDVKMKNIYVQRYDNKQWESINSTMLSHCNDWANNKTGKHSFGATEEYFWAKAGGFLEEGVDQKQYDAEWKPTVYTITQPEQPTFGEPAVKDIQIRERNGSWSAKWVMETSSTPQFSYTLKVKGEDGKVLQSFAATKPEDFYVVLDKVETDIFTCEMSITDIFGKSTTFTKGSPAYVEKYGEVTSDGSAGAADNGSNMGLIIGIAAGAVAVLAIAGVSVMVELKAKKKKS